MTWDHDGGINDFLLSRHIILVTHDESTFYGNDWHLVRWINDEETPLPHTMGEGPSIMVSDFCLPDIGWLWSKDGQVIK